MGVKCCTEGGRKSEFDSEVIIDRLKHKKKSKSSPPIEKGSAESQRVKSEYKIDSGEDEMVSLTLSYEFFSLIKI